MRTTVDDLATQVGVARACKVLGVPRSSYYRMRAARRGALAAAAEPAPPAAALPPPRGAVPLGTRSPRSLSQAERDYVRAVLNSARFADCAPREVYASLLDEGIYLCSWSTMYRILRAANEVTRRRDQRRGAYAKPELLATRPNQLWSWDSTKLKGPTTWSYYYLYVILDVYSRYGVGWMIAERETAELAEAFSAETCAKEGVAPEQLTLHADRGSAMTSKCVAHLLADPGVTKTHSRPQVSNDNPFSEAQFKTLKYHPSTPARFGSVADARAWAQALFHWYNEAQHHTGIALLTPATVHRGMAAQVLAARQEVVLAAYAAHPERFVRGVPQPAAVPAAVWINPPAAQPTSPLPQVVAPTERTAPSQPPTGLGSNREAAPRPLDPRGTVATLERARSDRRQSDAVHPHFHVNLSHTA